MPFRLTDKIKQDILTACRETPEPDREACGFVIKAQKGYKIYPCENQSEDWTDFEISAVDYAKADKAGAIAAIYHSHIRDAEPTQADIAAANAIGLPYLIACVELEEVKLVQPGVSTIPLKGREFKYGVLDCYSLVRDAYAEIGIELNDYPRGKFGEWNNPGWNLFAESVAAEGFVELAPDEPLQQYDLILMSCECDRPGIANHAALYWSEERRSILHHCLNQLSREDVYGGYWAQCTVKKLRHKELMEDAE